MTYTSNDKTLTVSHPANWKSMSMTMSGTSAEVSYRPTKNVYIRFGTDLQGSLMADIAKSTGGGGFGGIDTSGMPGELGNQLGSVQEKRKSPLESVHEMDMAVLAKEFDGYQEGKTRPAQLAGMEAIETDFTCQRKDLFRTKQVSGKRMTALSNDRRVTMLYYMPSEYQDKLGPVFAKMIKSMKVNPQGG